jgi:hypothetical protein
MSFYFTWLRMRFYSELSVRICVFFADSFLWFAAMTRGATTASIRTTSAIRTAATMTPRDTLTPMQHKKVIIRAEDFKSLMVICKHILYGHM